MIIVYKSTGTEAISCLSPIVSDRIGSGENKKENLPHTRETMTKLSLSLYLTIPYTRTVCYHHDWEEGKTNAMFSLLFRCLGQQQWHKKKTKKNKNKEAKEYSNNK